MLEYVIWNDVSKIINTEIKWENIVVGMITSDCDSSSKCFINVLTSIVAYALFAGSLEMLAIMDKDRY